jgi:hypothetical protein
MRAPRYFGWWVLGLFPAAFFGWIAYTAVVVGADKSVNSEVGILWETTDRVPLGTVVPANNRWISHAFIADRAHDPLVRRSVLILDDHYRSGDLTLRTESGVIGDGISRPVLCSVPAQAKAKSVKVDPVVEKLLNAECA